MVKRRRFADWTILELEELAHAYKMIAALKPGNPTCLQGQAAIHRACGMGALKIHSNRRFLPWHRGFLYFHEKILQMVLGNKNFRLPVWDWEQEALNTKYQGVRAAVLPACSIELRGNLKDIPSQVRAWLLSGDAHCPGGGAGFDKWVGGIPNSGDRAVSNASQDVHMNVHGLSGNLMSDINVAAFDPLFYAHHANVDRMWWYWSNTFPCEVARDADEWKNQSFVFFDEYSQPVSVTTGALENLSLLGYYYDKPDLSLEKFRRQEIEQFRADKSVTTGTIPVLIEIPASSGVMALDPKEYYGVGLSTGNDQPIVLGGFVDLMSEHMHHGSRFVSGSLNTEGIRILQSRVPYALVWGILDDGNQLIGAVPLKDAILTIFTDKKFI